MRRLRDDLDQAGASEKTLLIGADGGYTNKTVLTRLAPRTEFIGRIRKDAVLHSLPDAHSGLGRPRSYGAQTPTPEAFRQDDSIPWTTVKIFAAGREHDCEVKDIGPLLWRKAGCELPLRLIVIRPLGYKLTKNGRVLYRQPAYLITTALTRDLAVLIQAYVWRWEIEVNHRDEKQLIGVGQAQVRSEKSAERVPAFAVLCYSTLLLAAAHAFGIGATLPVTPFPSGSSAQPASRSASRHPRSSPACATSSSRAHSKTTCRVSPTSLARSNDTRSGRKGFCRPLTRSSSP